MYESYRITKLKIGESVNTPLRIKNVLEYIGKFKEAMVKLDEKLDIIIT
jgi:hypothetical protein